MEARKKILMGLLGVPAVALRGINMIGPTVGTTHEIAVPAGLKPGDRLVAMVFQRDATPNVVFPATFSFTGQFGLSLTNKAGAWGVTCAADVLTVPNPVPESVTITSNSAPTVVILLAINGAVSTSFGEFGCGDAAGVSSKDADSPNGVQGFDYLTFYAHAAGRDADVIAFDPPPEGFVVLEDTGPQSTVATRLIAGVKHVSTEASIAPTITGPAAVDTDWALVMYEAEFNR